VQIQVTDYNGADARFAGSHAPQWAEIAAALTAVPLHLKASDQARKIGAPIWDAVGNNSAIRAQLVERGWRPNVPIPAPLKILGKDVDFVKDGVAIEVQFSNYPFLLNNLLRCELFFKGRSQLGGSVVDAGVIITKGKMFDASQSTLHYEQAVNQLSALATNNVFDTPLRLVGLFEAYGSAIPVEWTTYSAPRYSRTISNRRTTTARIALGARPTSRAVITVA
jgi:hypothetical protein